MSNLRDFLSYEPKTDKSTLRPSPALDDIEIMIVLLEHGSIAESGTHSQLLENNGRYAEMWRVQTENYLAGCAAM